MNEQALYQTVYKFSNWVCASLRKNKAVPPKGRGRKKKSGEVFLQEVWNFWKHAPTWHIKRETFANSITIALLFFSFLSPGAVPLRFPSRYFHPDGVLCFFLGGKGMCNWSLLQATSGHRRCLSSGFSLRALNKSTEQHSSRKLRCYGKTTASAFLDESVRPKNIPK